MYPLTGVEAGGGAGTGGRGAGYAIGEDEIAGCVKKADRGHVEQKTRV